MKIVLFPPMSEVLKTELKNYSPKDIECIELTTSEFNRLWWECVRDNTISGSSPHGRFKWNGFEIREEGVNAA